MGVWIETPYIKYKDEVTAVTPFVGVWIETLRILVRCSSLMSHPSWVCGLKLACDKASVVYRASHPSWVCGLKLKDLASQIILMPVTPFVGVWIET